MYAAEKTMDADFALSQAIINRPNKTLPLSLPFIAQYCPILPSIAQTQKTRKLLCKRNIENNAEHYAYWPEQANLVILRLIIAWELKTWKIFKSSNVEGFLNRLFGVDLTKKGQIS